MFTALRLPWLAQSTRELLGYSFYASSESAYVHVRDFYRSLEDPSHRCEFPLWGLAVPRHSGQDILLDTVSLLADGPISRNSAADRQGNDFIAAEKILFIYPAKNRDEWAEARGLSRDATQIKIDYRDPENDQREQTSAVILAFSRGAATAVRPSDTEKPRHEVKALDPQSPAAKPLRLTRE